jgi:hypothetical protein
MLGAQQMLAASYSFFDMERIRARVLDFIEYAVNPLAGPLDSTVFLALLCVCAILFIWGLFRAKCSIKTYRGLVLAGALGALYFTLPEHFEQPVYLWIARGRIAPLVGFFLLLAPGIDRRSKARFFAAAAAAAALYVPLSTAVAYGGFGTDMAHFERVLAACPLEERVLTLSIKSDEDPYPGFNVPVMRELSSWVQVVHGGFAPLSFGRPIPFPFETKKTLPSPYWRRHDLYRSYLIPSIYGCVLTWNARLTSLHPLYPLALKQGDFALYRLKR